MTTPGPPDPEHLATPRNDAPRGASPRRETEAAGTAVGDVVVAIDGPAGAGKSTVARRVAAAAGLRYLDTGMTYRAVTAGLLRRGAAATDPAAVTRTLPTLRLELRPDPAVPDRLRVWLDGAELTDADLRSEPVNRAVSPVATVAAVREHLVGLQRAAMAGGGIVAEGRDIGTTVWPHAEVKVFLTADPAERARRRAAEAGPAAAAAVAERDRLDGGRAISPTQPAADAVEIDSTDLPEDAVVAQVLRLVEAARQRVAAAR